MQYDDLYRLTQVTYNSGGDAFSPPLASGTGGRVDNAVPYTTTAKRIQNQAFAYDYMGNITKSTDDANLLFDRLHGNGPISAEPPEIKLRRPVRAPTARAPTSWPPPMTLAATSCAHRTANGSPVRRRTRRVHPALRVRLGRSWPARRARRWDYTGPYSASAPAYPARPSETPAADLSFTYDSSGQRTLKANTQAVRATEAARRNTPLEIFNSLRLDGANWDEGDNEYEDDEVTETAYSHAGWAIVRACRLRSGSAHAVHGRLLDSTSSCT